MTILDTKTETKTPGRHARNSRPLHRPVWRPEPIGLTRDELRAIVADMLG